MASFGKQQTAPPIVYGAVLGHESVDHGGSGDTDDRRPKKIHQGVPLYASGPAGGGDSPPTSPTHNHLQRFVVGPTHDRWAAVLFYASLLLTFLLAHRNGWPSSSTFSSHQAPHQPQDGNAGPQGSSAGLTSMHGTGARHLTASAGNHDNLAAGGDGGAVNTMTPNAWLEGLATTIVLSIVLAYLCLRAMRSYPLRYILSCLVLQGLLFAFISVLAIRTGSLLLGFICCLASLAYFFYVYILMTTRAPTASVLLYCSSNVVLSYPGTVIASTLFAVAMAAYVLPWLAAAAPSLREFQAVLATKYAHPSASQWATMIGFMFQLFWTSEVLVNVPHVVAAGTMATWYFTGGAPHMPANPALASFKRAVTSSFGSVCLGSLLMALMRTLHWIIHIIRGMARRDERSIWCVLLICCADCWARMLQDVLEIFNVYAFTHIAIYGSSYMEAGKETLELTKSSFAWAGLVADSLMQPVMVASTLFGAATVAVVVAYGVVPSSAPAGIGMLAFFVAAWFIYVTLRPVYACETALFVCLAECSAALPLELRRRLDFAAAAIADDRSTSTAV